MKVVDIRDLTPNVRFDADHDCINVIVTMDNGQTACITACTASYLPEYLSDNDLAFLPPDSDLVVVQSLTNGCMREAIEAYANDRDYWERVRVKKAKGRAKRRGVKRGDVVGEGEAVDGPGRAD